MKTTFYPHDTVSLIHRSSWIDTVTVVAVNKLRDWQDPLTKRRRAEFYAEPFVRGVLSYVSGSTPDELTVNELCRAIAIAVRQNIVDKTTSMLEQI